MVPGGPVREPSSWMVNWTVPASPPQLSVTCLLVEVCGSGALPDGRGAGEPGTAADGGGCGARAGELAAGG